MMISAVADTPSAAPAPASADFDVIIIGGGPAGSTAAIVLARAGRRVAVLEKSRFPRFHIGETFVPRAYNLIRDLGLLDALNAVPNVPKYGAEFGMGDCPSDKTRRFSFTQDFSPGGTTFNIERAPFDHMLLREARSAGAVVYEETTVKKIGRLSDGDVQLETTAGDLTARYLIDASGQQAVVGRHLGTRVPAPERHLKKVAYFQHFKGVLRLPGDEAGHPAIFMCDEGWFWVIHIDAERTSIGLVVDAHIAREVGVPADRMLAWGMARCPILRERTVNATGPETNRVLADFSYRCRPYAGPGHFLVGDAAAFMDPIFSTGVCLAMMGAHHAAGLVNDLLAGKVSPAPARRRHIRFIEGSTSSFFRLIEKYYDQSFRELFLNGVGPYRMHQAVIAVLAGRVFPKPPWAIRWRMTAFYFCVWLNRYVRLVPRQRPFSLLASAAVPAMTPVAEVAMGS